MPQADVWRADRQANEDFMDEAVRKRLIEAMARAVITHAEELTELDRQIGDGDHGLNMKRGFEAVLEMLPATAAKPLPEALKGVGTTLVMKVGGASGPLYGTFFLALAKTMPDTPTAAALAEAFAAAVEAVKARGKSQAGQKTMLDVLVPVAAVLSAGGEGLRSRVRTETLAAAEATRPMKAIRGRASFLGERSIGHLDPGARSSALMIAAVCDAIGG
jgi:phosphoenolpyruvate---glycerone phosphotransferase subunit DhaL